MGRKIPKLKNEKYQRYFQKDNLTWKDLCNVIKSSESYYLRRNGLIISDTSKKINSTEASYILAILEGFKTENDKQFFAWMKKDEKGIFKNIHFGSIQEFSSIIEKETFKEEEKI